MSVQVRAVASAQPFGFGPVAKMVSLAACLDPIKTTFVGEGTALRYAELNNRHLAGVEPFDLDNIYKTRDLVARFDVALSVMEPRLAFAAVRRKRPTYFFDSLLGFWLSSRSDQELASIAVAIKGGSDETAEQAFRELSVHESMIVAHMIATRSFAQSLPGVAERIDSLRALGLNHVQAIGPIIDTRAVSKSGVYARHKASIGRDLRTLVVNLGGFGNPFIDIERDRAYVDIILRWLSRLAARARPFDEVVVCSGAFKALETWQINGVKFQTGLLSHGDLMGLLVRDPIYLIPPGLTSLHEAIALSVVPMLLPDQHYGHLCNRERLRPSGLHGACFSDLGLYAQLPNDDFVGTCAISAVAIQVRKEPAVFQSFADYMDALLARFIEADPHEIEASLSQIRSILSGVPMQTVTEMIRQEILREAFQCAN